jgi:hypothetical protein
MAHIVRISQIFKPDVCGVVDHFRGSIPDLLHELFKRFGFGLFPRDHSVLLVDELDPFRIVSFYGPFFLFFSQVLDEDIEFMQVGVRQDRAD